MKNLKESVLEEARKGKGLGMKLNLLREALHHLLLQELDRKGGFQQICFLGGTALRVVYGLDRFSEDLDFSKSLNMDKNFDLPSLVNPVQRSLYDFGFECSIEKMNIETNVKKCFFVFTGLLYELDRSFRKNQKLAIKFDVDSKPPAGAQEMLSPITGSRVYKVRHYNLPSLFAGKLHAILFRYYTKGRDLYDFLWYMGKKVPVNLTLLENAISQTTGNPTKLDIEGLKHRLQERFEKVDFEKAKKDVEVFLTDPSSLSLFEKNLFLQSVDSIQIS